MNPIPLSAPSGRVYAYACGICHHTCASSELWGRPETSGPHEELVEASERDAERCCTCLRCRRPGVDGFCDDCNWDTWMRRLWDSIALCMLKGFTTEDELDEYTWRDDE